MYIDPSCTIAAEYTCSKCLGYNQPWVYHPPAITFFRWGKSTHPYMVISGFGLPGQKALRMIRNVKMEFQPTKHIAIYCNQMDHIDFTYAVFLKTGYPWVPRKPLNHHYISLCFPIKMVILAVDTWLSSIFSLTQISWIPILVCKIINSHSGCLNPDSCRLNWRLNPKHFVDQIPKWIQISTIFVVKIPYSYY